MKARFFALPAATLALTACADNYAKSMGMRWQAVAADRESSEWAKCIDNGAQAYIRGEAKFAGTKLGDQPWYYLDAWFPLVMSGCSTLQSARELHRSSPGHVVPDIEAAYYHASELVGSQAHLETLQEVTPPRAKN